LAAAFFFKIAENDIEESPMRTVTALLVLSLGFLSSASSRHLRAEAPAPPFVIVQAVDSMWLPVPGAVVQLRERGRTGTAHKATTDADGYASFRFDPPDAQQSFDITVTMAGFKDGELKDVRFGVCHGDCSLSRYVQVRLAVAGPAFTIK
jgi:hypothetical protein